MYSYPYIYDYYVPEEFFVENPTLSGVVKKKHVTSEPWMNTQSFTTDGGQEFISYFKYKKFGRGMKP